MWKWIAGMAVAAILSFVGYTYLLLDEPEVPRSLMEAKYATPPSKFLVLPDGRRIHYRERGPRNAPALVLLHGFMGTLFVWEPWSHALSDGFRVISLDLPGHGLTGAVPGDDYSQAAMTDCVKAVADKLGLAKFAVAGNSMGGAVAARFAERYPERVSHLILIDAAGAWINRRPRLHLTYFAVHTPVLDRWVTHAVISRLPDLGRMEGSRRALRAHLGLPDDTFVWDHVNAIRAPTLILWGRKDRLIPLEAADAWHKAISGSKLIIYPDAAHVSMADVPAQSARDVRDFLAPPR
jgi:pimeloyl-ACP methyl ester carboxylesterase